jgi:hypothetical protein
MEKLLVRWAQSLSSVDEYSHMPDNSAQPIQGYQAYEPQAVGYAPMAPAQMGAPQYAQYQPAPEGHYQPAEPYSQPYGGGMQPYGGGMQPYGGGNGTYTPPQGSPPHALKPGQELEAEF